MGGYYDDMGPEEYYDDLGGAMYFADDEESFEPRTPDGGPGCGCPAAALLILVPLYVIASFLFG